MVRKEQLLASKPSEIGRCLGSPLRCSHPSRPRYPTAVLLIGNSVSLEDNTRSDIVVRYYLEFDTDIPDELFQAEVVNEGEVTVATLRSQV